MYCKLIFPVHKFINITNACNQNFAPYTRTCVDVHVNLLHTNVHVRTCILYM